MSIVRYFQVALATTLNIILNALTWGKFVWLEGRVKNGMFHNWALGFKYKPQQFEQPTTEQQIIDIIKKSHSVRVFGSAHSFNTGIVSEQTLMSLDRYAGVISKDLPNKQMTFRAGTRVRDIIETLLEHGLAFEALPSHDAQSIAGIISTDVHGTGRDWGWVSQAIVSLKLIDGNGDVHVVMPDDDLYKAAIGGVGACGIITEVTIQAVERFNVEQKTWISTIPHIEKNLESLLQDHDHVSLYLFPFTQYCQVNTWDRSHQPKTKLGTVKEFLSISLDALFAAWFGNLLAATGLLPKFAGLGVAVKRGTNVTLESAAAYNRTMYHMHQELEFTIPQAETLAECKRFIGLYETQYRSKRLPMILLEVRFTPAGHTRTLLGAGRDYACGWIDLIFNDLTGSNAFYEVAEQTMKEIGARPHLGKFCQSISADDLLALHGDNFTRFVELRKAHDPDGKFANGFTNRLFGEL